MFCFIITIMNNKLEDIEAKSLSKRLTLNNYDHTHIWNESWIHWKAAIIQAVKKKSMWQSAWFPDYCIVLKKWSLLFLELKKKRKVLKSWKLSTSKETSTEQDKRLDILWSIDNVYSCVWYWWRDSIEKIKEFETL